MSLYKKHRPQEFSAVQGNDAAVKLLQELVSSPAEKRPHAFGIFGGSGCGKTTLARIAARQLGASELSTHEINSSNNRGIDTAREIQEAIKYQSADGAPTVYIIDECHKATNDWQNAMLKVLEDTPAHVYFFLCTTEPAKLIKAIHTRLTRVDVQTLSEEDLGRLVKRVAKAESIALPEPVLEKILECADGSPRQALVFLESCSVLNTEEEMLAAVNRSDEVEVGAIDLIKALIGRGAWRTVAPVLEGLKAQDPESIRRAVLGYCSSTVIRSGKRDYAFLMECFSEPTYNMGFAGIVLAAYTAHEGLAK